MDTNLLYTLLLIFPALMCFAGAMDFFTMTIPNKISLVLVAAFLAAAVAVEMPLNTFLTHVTVGSIVLGLCIIMFAYNVLGGGDAKLLPAATLWIGFEQLPMYLYSVVLLGGLLSFAILYYRAGALPTWLSGQTWATRLHSITAGVPYGVAIGGGALLVFPTTSWFSILVAAS